MCYVAENEVVRDRLRADKGLPSGQFARLQMNIKVLKFQFFSTSWHPADTQAFCQIDTFLILVCTRNSDCGKALRQSMKVFALFFAGQKLIKLRDEYSASRKILKQR